MTLAQNIKDIRRAKKLSRRQLGLLTGMSQEYIAGLETGTRKNPSLDKLQKLAKSLNVTIADIIRGEGEKAETFGTQLDDLCRKNNIIVDDLTEEEYEVVLGKILLLLNNLQHGPKKKENVRYQRKVFKGDWELENLDIEEDDEDEFEE